MLLSRIPRKDLVLETGPVPGSVLVKMREITLLPFSSMGVGRY